MAFTTWSTTDKLNVTLSGGNLTATGGGTYGGARSADSQISGKFYWECTVSTWTNNQTNVGICGAGCVLAKENGSFPTTGMVSVYKNGTIFVGHDTATMSSTGLQLGARASGDIIGIAIDLGAQLAWLRVAPSGNWNGSSTANPATGTGGIAILSGAGFATYALASFQLAADVITANFGGGAFSGTVTSGFTSGFPAGTTSPTNAVATQFAFEQFITTNPLAQVTQVSLEQWASVAAYVPPVPRKGSVWVMA